MANVVDTIIIFRILRKLTTPWEKTEAFKTGVIDKNGKVLVKAKQRTQAQKKSYSMLDRLVFNLKRALEKLPGGNSTVGSYVAALALIKEHVDTHYNQETSAVLLETLEERNIAPISLKEYDLSTPEGFMDAFEDAIVAEMTSGASFGGAFSGAGSNAEVNKTGMAGVDPLLGKKKRKKSITNILKNRP